jgi:predicted alpha/beta superfamily hydrolase
MKHIIFNGLLAMALAAGAGCRAGAEEADMQVTFRVQAEAPEGSALYVVGNDVALGAWDPAAVSLERQADGTWARTVSLRRGRRVEFKITRGSWATEALDEQGRRGPNHVLQVGASDEVVVRVGGWRDQLAAEPGVTGVLKFHPGVGGPGVAPRMISVWLPPGYDAEPARRYPVLYMHDGQNCFDPARSAFGMEWRMDEEATRLIEAGRIEPLIIVGMDCNGEKRFEEYSDGELGQAYRNYVVQVVKPLIDQTYRTRSEREHTAVMGSSMGGCVSFLLIWEHPEVFSRAGCLSPAFFKPDFARVRAYRGERKPIRIYLDNGEVGLEKKLQKGIDQMLALLPKKGFQEGRDYQWFLDPGAEHNENAWAARVWRPLEFMFGLNQGDENAPR